MSNSSYELIEGGEERLAPDANAKVVIAAALSALARRRAASEPRKDDGRLRWRFSNRGWATSAIDARRRP